MCTLGCSWTNENLITVVEEEEDEQEEDEEDEDEEEEGRMAPPRVGWPCGGREVVISTSRLRLSHQCDMVLDGVRSGLHSVPLHSHQYSTFASTVHLPHPIKRGRASVRA